MMETGPTCCLKNRWKFLSKLNVLSIIIKIFFNSGGAGRINSVMYQELRLLLNLSYVNVLSGFTKGLTSLYFNIINILEFKQGMVNQQP